MTLLLRVIFYDPSVYMGGVSQPFHLMGDLHLSKTLPLLGVPVGLCLVLPVCFSLLCCKLLVGNDPRVSQVLIGCSGHLNYKQAARWVLHNAARRALAPQSILTLVWSLLTPESTYSLNMCCSMLFTNFRRFPPKGRGLVKISASFSLDGTYAVRHSSLAQPSLTRWYAML